VSANLQLIADLGYGDVALAIVDERGDLTVVADARPSTAVDPFVSSRGPRAATQRGARGLRDVRGRAERRGTHPPSRAWHHV